MTIYILDNDPKKIAEYLDDNSLGKMIKDIAQVLCNVHYQCIEDLKGISADERLDKFWELEDIYTIDFSNPNISKLSQWAIECVANYQHLILLGIALCDEHAFRFYKKGKIHKIVKYENVISWARDNVPDYRKDPFDFSNRDMVPCPDRLAGCLVAHFGPEKITPFPLVMPDKFKSHNITKDHTDIYKVFPNRIVESYRNYYQAKLKKMIKEQILNRRLQTQLWTRREKPEWLNL